MSMSPALRRALTNKEQGSCPTCGDTEAMTKHGICYACHRQHVGLAEVEQHEPIGRKNEADSVTVPANMHRSLTSRQRTWPDRLKSNPEHDPLITIAQTVRAIGDYAHYLAARCDRISDWLLALSLWLSKRFGTAWWMEFTPLW